MANITGTHAGAPTALDLANAPTLGLEAGAETTLAEGSARADISLRSTVRRTVLPEVKSQGAKVLLVPRDADRYASKKLLGEGGMGEVDLALDQDIDRLVAVKRLKEAAGPPQVLARFIDEVRTVGRLEHPNIVPIHDVGQEEDGTYYFVMKYVEGETLEDVIDDLAQADPDAHRRFGFERRVELFLGVLNALSYAHERRILHRDLKPANVMIGPHGEVMLMDWGIARPIGAPEEVWGDGEEDDREPEEHVRAASTRHGALIGTPMYMSPEQAQGHTDQLDERSDLYSAAMIFLELMALRHPLDDCKNVTEVVTRVLADPAPSLVSGFYEHEGQPPVPAEYRHFFRRALSKDPADRFASAAEMIAELDRIRSGDFRIQCPVTFMKRNGIRAVRFVDRHPAVAMMVPGGLAALVLVALVFGVWGLLRVMA